MTGESAPSPEVRSGSLRRATVGMAAGTAFSRLSGVGRVLALAYVLGFHRLADSYNLANTTPNMLYDVVLGGVLSATFVPVFVDRLATRNQRQAWRSVSALVTLSIVVLLAATIIFWLVAPWVIDAFTVLDHTHGATVGSIAHERAVATSLLRWFVPQVFFYGFISLATALLNTRGRFGAPMWAPISNNLICIAVLLWFHHIAGPSPTLASVQLHTSQMVLLGLGTTLGVAVQALLLFPSLARGGLGRVRWIWDPRDEAVTTMVRLGAWTFGFVMANQVALFVVLALAGSAGPGAVSSYTYAYIFMQMPYAVVAVSVMSAVAPDLARSWSTANVDAFRKRLQGGLRAVLAIILPAALGMLLLAKPAVTLLLGHGATVAGSSGGTGSALALLSAGLPGFCTYLYVVRVLQSMQRTRVAFWLYLVENGINVVLAVVLVHSLGVRGLAISLSVAYTVAAVCGILVLRRWLGPLGTARSWYPLRRVVISTLIMGAAVLIVSNLSGANHGAGLWIRVCGSVLAGVVAFAGTAAFLANRRGADQDHAGHDDHPPRNHQPSELPTSRLPSPRLPRLPHPRRW